jgi:glycosyltransferase involved in cell wall biosynthesis
LAILTFSYGKFVGIPIIIDAHNAGIFPLEGRKRWLNCMAMFVIKKVELVIVTNEYLASYIAKRGGRPFVLPDPIPQIKNCDKSQLRGQKNVLYICSFSDDEPYEEVIRAATMLEKDIVIYITGNGRKKSLLEQKLPANVVLTGFIPKQDYERMLYSADVIMDLTTRDNCLLCGAYEAVAVGKPIILSDRKVLRESFSKGTLFTNNLSEDIAAKITESLCHLDRLKEEAIEQRVEIEQRWEQRRYEIEKIIQELSDK